MSDSKESTSQDSVPAGSCEIPRGPKMGDIVPDGHVACFKETDESPTATLHQCKGGQWTDTGVECDPDE